MSNPLVSQLPTMAVRGDAPELFTARANASLGALPQLQSELNTLSDWINITSDAINLAKNTAVSVKDTAVAAKNTAVSAKDTAVAVKNTAVSAKDTAVAAKNDAVAAKNTAVAIAQGGNVLATDALRASGDNVILAKGDGSTESVAFVATNSSRALHADALRISGSNIQLVKANGASETVSIGTLISRLAAHVQGVYRVAYSTSAINAIISGGSLLNAYIGIDGELVTQSLGLTGSWRNMGGVSTMVASNRAYTICLFKRI